MPVKGYSRGTSGPASDAKAVTPSDSTDLPNGIARSLLVIAAGNVSFITAKGTTQTYSSVPAYTVIPVAASRVRATGTTATVVALY